MSKFYSPTKQVRHVRTEREILVTSAQQAQGFDPFEQGDGVKATTFKEAPYGAMLTIQIDDDAKWLQTRDFKTNEPAYWDARPGETPNPKMAAVITGTVANTPWAQQSGQAGERRSVWAEKPSNLFTAIQNAKRAAGGGTPLPILRGGTLDIAFTGEEAPKDPRNNPIKVYQARYTPPPAGFGQQDAFEGGQTYTGQQQAPAQQPQSAFAQQAAPQVAQVGNVAQPFGQPQGQPFQQQAPAAQQQIAPGQAQFGQPQGQFAQGGFVGQAALQQDPWAAQQQAPQQQQAPAAQPQQPAMAGAPAGGDPWASAPQADVPSF